MLDRDKIDPKFTPEMLDVMVAPCIEALDLKSKSQ